MRVILVAALALLSATSAAADGDQGRVTPKSQEADGIARSDCPPTVAQQVAKEIRDGTKPQLFRRLDTLPPATAYAAVVREIDGCDAPLTMVEYRSGGRP